VKEFLGGDQGIERHAVQCERIGGTHDTSVFLLTGLEPSRHTPPAALPVEEERLLGRVSVR
jgi:hypothetical protein